MSEPEDDQTSFGDIEARRAAEALIVDVDGFEGPLDMLLTMARSAKVDLRKISILALAEQYLAFVEHAGELRIELAADYLVMAAWMAFLKSKLLLPPDPKEEGPSAEEMAAHLAFQLERLAAMRDAASRLMGRDRLGRDIFVRGMSEGIATHRAVTYDANILDLMQAYARIRTKDEFRPYVMDRDAILTMEQALERLRSMIGFAGNWSDLTSYLPDDWQGDPGRRRSSLAATFAASLELAKEGRLEIRQEDLFGKIEIRKT